MLNEEQGYALADIARRLANVIRIGKVCEVDYSKAKARVKIGDLTTGFLPWITERAGTNRTWSPIDIGEQVVVFSPNGELERGVILHSLYQTANPAPETSKHIQKVIFEDGSIVQYDKAAKRLFIDLKGTADISIAGVVNVSAKTANITAETTTINGNASITGNVTLAGGGAPIARLGDPVSVNPLTHVGQIDGGSTKVTSG